MRRVFHTVRTRSGQRRSPASRPLPGLLAGWLFLSAVCLVAAGRPAAAGNVVVNGDFELPVSTGEGRPGAKAVPGWVIEDVDNNAVDQYRDYWQAASGNQSIDLNGLAPSVFYQDIPTIPGITYYLRFAAAGNPVGTPPKKTSEVWWGDTRLAELTFDTDTYSVDNMGWAYHSYTVTATETTTRLMFKSTTQGWHGPTLDDVSVLGSLPDLMIKRDADPDTAFAQDNIYQTTAAGAQILRQTAQPDETVTYQVKVENDTGGSGSRSFTIKAVETAGTGWTVSYKVGVNDITAQILGPDGYTTPVLAPDASMVITITMKPDRTVLAGHSKSTTLTATASGILSDTVQATTTVASFTQGDLLIKAAADPEAAYALNDIYQQTPAAEQIKPQYLTAGTAVFTIRLENDTNTGQPVKYVLKAAETTNDQWTIVYKGPDGKDITTDIKGTAGYKAPELAPNASLLITVEITPDADIRGGATCGTVIKSYVSGQDTADDAVKAEVNISTVSAPDLQIKRATDADTAYALNNVYQATASGAQLLSHFTAAGTAAVYDIKLENDNNTGTTRSLILRAIEGVGADWQTTYRIGTTDISSLITDPRGYKSVPLPPGGSIVVTATVTPSPQALGGSSKTVVIQSFFDIDDRQVRDSVQATTRVSTTAQAYLLIKQPTEPDWMYGSNDVYQSDPSADQVEAQQVRPSAPAVYSIKIQNDGNAAQSFVLRAAETAGAGWAIVYKVDGAVVTGLIKGTWGFTTPTLAQYATCILTVEMTPGTSLPINSTKSSTIRVYMDGNDTTVRDVVKATTTVADIVQPDLLIRRQAEDDTAYGIDNTYQTSASGHQVRTQAVAVGTPAVYYVKLQNDGSLRRSFLVKASETSVAGWTVSYEVAGTDIGAKAKSAAGWATPLMAVNETLLITITATPSAAVPAGASKSAILKVFLDATDTTVRDMVHARTTLAPADRPDLLIKKAADPDTAYSLDQGYQSTPWGDQVQSQEVGPAVTAGFQVKVQNDGAAPRSFVVRAVESSASGWITAYKVGGEEITSQIQGPDGYAIADLDPANANPPVITVEVTPGPLALAGTSKAITLNVFLDGADTTVRDSVKAMVKVASFEQPDLLIKRLADDDSAYAMDDTYQEEPSGAQVVSQSVIRGMAGKYLIRIQNDGNTVRSFVIRAEEETQNGWSVAYRAGSTDIAALVKGPDGYTTPRLSPGRYHLVVVEARPDSTVPPETPFDVTVKASLDAGDTTVRDSVKMTTTRQ